MISFFKKKNGLKRGDFGKKNRRRKIFFIFFVGILLTSILSFLFIKFSKVTDLSINLKGVNCTDESALKKDLDILGRNILLINESDLNSKVKEKYNCIENVEIKRGLSKVEVDVFGTKAVLFVRVRENSIFPDLSSLEASTSSQTAVLKIDESTPSSSRNFLVNDRGVVFEEANNSDLPKIDYVTSLKIGDGIGEQKTQNILKILEKFKSLSINDSKNIVEKNILVNPGPPQILLSLNKDPLRQAASLQLILQKAKMDSKQVEKIDLRFDKPVVVYVPEKEMNRKVVYPNG